VADGRAIERDVRAVWIRYGEEVAATRVVFGEANDAAALGVVTLEELALAVDPSGERLGLPAA
jgi:hypothetical protein